MVTMAQNAANWCNTHTHVDRMHSLTHIHQHSYNHFVRNASSAITAITAMESKHKLVRVNDRIQLSDDF